MRLEPMELRGHVRVNKVKGGFRYDFRIRHPRLTLSKRFRSLRELKTFLKHKGIIYDVTYSNEIKASAMEMIVSGIPRKDIAIKLKVSLDTINTWYTNLYLPQINFHGYRYVLTYESLVNDEIKQVA